MMEMEKEWRETVQQAERLFGRDYLLRQLAEEAMEVAVAALKMIRAEHGETPLTPEQARDGLIEEMADTLNQVEAIYTLLAPEEQGALRLIRRMKQRRWHNRMRKEGDDGAEETGMEGMGDADLPEVRA